MNLKRKTTQTLYEGRLVVCTEEEYPHVRQTLLDLMSSDGRSEAVTQIASCELQRLDKIYKQED